MGQPAGSGCGDPLSFGGLAFGERAYIRLSSKVRLWSHREWEEESKTPKSSLSNGIDLLHLGGLTTISFHLILKVTRHDSYVPQFSVCQQPEINYQNNSRDLPSPIWRKFTFLIQYSGVFIRIFPVSPWIYIRSSWERSNNKASRAYLNVRLDYL